MGQNFNSIENVAQSLNINFDSGQLKIVKIFDKLNFQVQETQLDRY